MLEFNLASKKIKTERKAFVMGIVNTTPDSFFEGSRGGFERAMQLVEEGADIIDLGAESTRPGSVYPGSAYIDEDEELRRLLPVLRAIRKVSDVTISIDTRKKNVMQAAFEEGADILNDVSAMEDDENMASFISEKKIPVILMHSVPLSKINLSEGEVFSEVKDYLLKRADFALQCGIAPEKIILDPGIGFKKELSDNVSLIKHCGELGDGKYQVMMALSRKRCIGEMTGRTTEERLSGTLAANLVSVIKGATFVRVHDVKETIDTLQILQYTI